MKKICICGSYGFGKTSLNGQTIKTEIVTEYYQSVYGKDGVMTIDTQGIKNIIMVSFKLLWAFVSCRNIVILPAHNSLRLLAPLCRIYQLFTKKKTHYFVIGGWLAHYLEKHPIVLWGIKSFFGIYVETNTMKVSLTNKGLKNVLVVPNCKFLNIDNGYGRRVAYPPIKLCTFSRINRLKGIGDAVAAVDEINKEYGEVTVTLDIYGRVDAGEQEWFENLKKNLPAGVQVKGAIPYDQSVNTLKKYHALLFPTRYYTEGIPGTIIDAYAAGIPVIASGWESCNDVVADKKTGFVYAFKDNNALKETIKDIINEPEKLLKMKFFCLIAARDYLPENVLSKIKLL